MGMFSVRLSLLYPRYKTNCVFHNGNAEGHSFVSKDITAGEYEAYKISSWIVSNLNKSWVISVHNRLDMRHVYVRVHFEDIDDFMLFRLRWE